jgi:hypothetical protein
VVQSGNCWIERRVGLKFLLGETLLFTARVSLLTLDTHFTELLDNSDQPTMSIEHIPPSADGFLVRSQPTQEVLPSVRVLSDSILYAPAQYRRFYIELQDSFAKYVGKFSSKSRWTLLRKVRKFAEFSGGHVDWREYRTPVEIREFYPVARRISALTYQERLLKAGLPESEDFQRSALELANRGLARGYLLYHHENAIAYMFCTLRDPGILICRYVGYDPKFRSWSPGTVLHYLTIEMLFAQRDVRILDFTEGEGEHKKFFATGSTRCADVYHFRRRVRIIFLIYLHLMMNWLSGAIVRALDQLGLKAQVKKFLRSELSFLSAAIPSGRPSR